MPSVKRHRYRHLAVLTLSGVLVAGTLAGCSTTQEKAAAHQAEAERILEAREKRQQRKKNKKQQVDGPEIRPYGGKSAHQQGEKR